MVTTLMIYSINSGLLTRCAHFFLIEGLDQPDRHHSVIAVTAVVTVSKMFQAPPS